MTKLTVVFRNSANARNSIKNLHPFNL